MSWLQPTEYEQTLLDQAIDELPVEVVELARLVSLVPRVEPLLLRNSRLEFLPAAEAEVESLLWFSNLVSIRSTQNFLLHPGVARLLANGFVDAADPEISQQFEAVWRFSCEHTVHWNPLDRLERDLRYYVLIKDAQAIREGLQDMLRRITQVPLEEARLDLARWAKRNLPSLIEPHTATEESRLLAQYAGIALADASTWVELSEPTPLPKWLATNLPEPIGESRIGLQLRYDADTQQQVLECLDAEAAPMTLKLSNPLPVKVHLRCEGRGGKWETLNLGSRIILSSVSTSIRLTTLEGLQYEIKAESILPVGNTTKSEILIRKIYLTHVESDTEQAKRLADWLAEHQIQVELLLEKPGDTGLPWDPHDKTRLLRLWTSAAQRAWGSRKPEEMVSPERSIKEQKDSATLPEHSLGVIPSILLRIEDVPPPTGWNDNARLLDLFTWQQRSEQENRESLEQISRFVSGEAPEPIPPDSGIMEEIQSLLAEIEDPETSPRRRLEIGDKLAELGDPRPGVGVYEVEIDDEQADSSSAATYAPPVQSLLDEINIIETQPKRRLAIGDKLAKLDDPRPGVGLDAQGLPDIYWVEIPAGQFIYGKVSEQQKLHLERFQVSRYPITNNQYQCFIDAGGYTEERWWRDLKKPEPKKSTWDQPNRPRTDVDWYEAVAFTRWLSAQLGQDIRLPTEQEWEKAARGEGGRKYPWGDDYINGYANVDESRNKGEKLGQTTAVGLYPQGHSPFGVSDMAGNVWEWCLNKGEHPEQIEPDTSGDSRVLRGGSWFSPPGDARAALRLWGYPVNRGGSRGFRVVLSAPIF